MFAHLHLSAMPLWALFNLAGLELYLGVLPLCGAALVLPRWLSGDEPRRRSFAAFTFALFCWLLALIGTYVTQNTHSGVYDRYTFYLAPLVLVAFLAWIADGVRRPRRAALVVALVAVALPLLVPYPRLFAGSWSGIAVNLGLLPLYVAERIVGWAGFYSLLALLLAGSAWLFLRRPPQNGRVLVGAVATALLVGNLVGHAVDTAGSATARSCVGDAAWLDNKVPRQATIVAVGSSSRAAGRCALLESLAASVQPTRLYSLGSPYLRGVDVALRRGADRTLLLPSGEPLRARYVVSDLAFAGTVLGRERNGLRLYQVPSGAARVRPPRSKP
jgi:hypothetical protein